MTIFHALILSIVEGLTEFLPVSSTGHLIIVGQLLGIAHTTFVSTFDIVIQLGAICAAILLYARRILTHRALCIKLIVAFIPSAIIGLTLYSFIKEVLLGNSYVTTIALIVGGFVLIAFDLLHKIKNDESDVAMESVSYKQAFLIGCAQVLAMVPGVSRSGATIVGGVGAGLSRAQAIEFSFMLAIPTMLAATVLDLMESGLSFTSHEWTLLGVGFVGAFVSAFIVIRVFLALLSRRTFLWFGIYRVIIGFLLLLFV